MSTTPLTDAINALTTYANTVTSASDTTLSDAVATLASGYGGGGGSGAEYTTFKYTPSETLLTFNVDVGSFTLADYYEVFVYSTNSTNDPSKETIVTACRYHVQFNYMGQNLKDFGRVDTRNAGSGTNWWNSPYVTLSQTGTTLNVTGNNSHAWFMSGIEYTFYVQNVISDWHE